MFLQAFIFVMLFGVVSWMLLPYFLNWIGNPIYQQALPWYPWLLAAMSINAISLVPHFALYAFGMDKPIIYSHIVAFFVFLVATWFLGEKYSVLAVPMSLNISFAFVLIFKALIYFFKINKIIDKVMSKSAPKIY
jgi:O-antigen/teichoic acid export membrane protein